MPEVSAPQFGLYFHWPFCAAKCPYCDFNSHVWSTVDHDAWLDAFLSEIRRIRGETEDRIVSTIFFGGGTPSLMRPKTVEAIINEVRALWRCSNSLEVTLEANPTSVEAGKFNDLARAGVNRVSLGLQALNDHDLKKLGRQHSADEGRTALDIALATFDRVSFDLIYARQDQTQDAWLSEVEKAVSFGATHMSLYQLTIEPGTAFHQRFQAGGLLGLPDDDRAADLFEMTQRVMEGAGLPAYETSNHAAPGEECRHNQLYWAGGDYGGIGPGAHGRLTLGGDRYATECARDPAAWLRKANAGSAEIVRTKLNSEERLIEVFVMGLRLYEGVKLNRVRKLKPREILYNNINILVEEGWLEQDRQTLRLTEAGRPLADSVVRRILT